MPTAGMCFWGFQRSFGGPEPDWTPQGLTQRRRGVSYEPRRSVSETKVITIPSLSRSLPNLQGVVDLSAYTNEQRPPTPTQHPRRPSIPIPPSVTESPAHQQSCGPATAAPSSESAGEDISLPPSPPLSSPLSPPCMSPILVELIQAHISSNPLQVKQVGPESILPTKGTPGSAGYNFDAAANILIPCRGQQRIPTGLAFTTPVVIYAKIQDRSGNASKLALRVEAGGFDHDYTGEVDIVLSNQAPQDHMVRQGDKVAQMTLQIHLNPLVQPVSKLQATERGSGGFGSTDTPERTVPPSPGKPHPPSKEEGAAISPVSLSKVTLLSPSRAQEYFLLVCTYITLSVAAHRAGMIHAGSETAHQGSAVNKVLGLVQGLVCSLLLAYSDSIKGHNHVGPANSGDLSGTWHVHPLPTHIFKALGPVRHTEPAVGVGLPHRVAVLLANTLAALTGTVPELVVEEATGSMDTELPSVSSHATARHPGANPSGCLAARINSAQVTELRAVTCESLALTNLDLLADSENSDCAPNSRVSSDIAASDTGCGWLSNVLQKSTKAVKSSFGTHEGRRNIRHFQAAARRKARQKCLDDRDDLAVSQDIVLLIERWAELLVDKCEFRGID